MPNMSHMMTKVIQLPLGVEHKKKDFKVISLLLCLCKAVFCFSL